MNRIIIVVAVLLAILISSSLYTVNETQVAIKLRLGEIVSVENKPGLKFKTPFVNNVVTFDQRIQTLDAQAESFLTVDKKNLKASGALMSSRLMPPKVGSSRSTVSMISSGSVVRMQTGNASTPAKCLNSSALPSMTGIPATAPMSPSPRIAVPLVTIATVRWMFV